MNAIRPTLVKSLFTSYMYMYMYTCVHLNPCTCIPYRHPSANNRVNVYEHCNVMCLAEPPSPPNCTAFYNLFYGIDPMASRVEPLLDSRFSEISPISVPPYRLYPSGSGVKVY